MPTGYTADIQSGKVTDLRTFALRCARAFGELILMRDDSVDAPIPEEFKPSDFYADALADARKRLLVLRSMSIEEAGRAAQKEFDESRKSDRERAAKQLEERSRYEAMLEKVKTWTPPTHEHLALKDFMRKQIEESVEFDCHGSYWPVPSLQRAEDWLRDNIAAVTRDIDYYTIEDAKERERAAARTAWVNALRESFRS